MVSQLTFESLLSALCVCRWVYMTYQYWQVIIVWAKGEQQAREEYLTVHVFVLAVSEWLCHSSAFQ